MSVTGSLWGWTTHWNTSLSFRKWHTLQHIVHKVLQWGAQSHHDGNLILVIGWACLIAIVFNYLTRKFHREGIMHVTESLLGWTTQSNASISFKYDVIYFNKLFIEEELITSMVYKTYIRLGNVFLSWLCRYIVMAMLCPRKHLTYKQIYNKGIDYRKLGRV